MTALWAQLPLQVLEHGMRELELGIMQDIVDDALGDLAVELALRASSHLRAVRTPRLGSEVMTASAHRLDNMRHFSLRFLRFTLRGEPMERHTYFNRLYFKFPS